jgi:hypothetical protein
VTRVTTWLGRPVAVYGDVVPSLVAIVQAFGTMLVTPDTYRHFAVTAWEGAVGSVSAAARVERPSGMRRRRVVGATL